MHGAYPKYRPNLLRLSALVIATVLLLGACGGGKKSSPPPSSSSSSSGGVSSYHIGGTLSGLSAGLSLQPNNNGGDTLTLSADGAFNFPTPLSTGATYAVSLATAPAGQVCTLTGATGTLAAADVTQVAVTCTTPAGLPNIVVNTAEPLSGKVQLALDNGVTYQAVTWYVDLRLLGTTTSGLGNPIDWNTSQETNGTHVILAKIQLAANSYTELRRTLTVSNSNLALSAQVSGTTGTINVDVNASSVYGIVRVEAALDAAPATSLTELNACHRFCGSNNDVYRFSIDAASIGSGSHNMLVTAIDKQGNRNTLSVAIPISNPANINLTSPTDGAFVYGSLTLSGTTSSDKLGPVTLTASLKDYEFLNTNASNFSGTMDLTGLAAGVYTLKVKATDSSQAVTSLERKVYVTSSAALRYNPNFAMGANGQLMSIDPTNPDLLLYRASDASYRLHNTVTQTHVKLQGTQDLPYFYDWTLSAGYAYASAGYLGSMGTGYNDCPVTCIYQWSPAGLKTNLSTANPNAVTSNVGGGRTYEQYPRAHGDHVIWIDAAGANRGTFTHYRVASQQYATIIQPADANYLINTEYDFFVDAKEEVTFFYTAQTGGEGNTSQFDVYRWSSTTNTSTKLTSGGARNTYPQTDGQRVIWQQSTSINGPTSLLAQAVSGGAITTLSSSASNYQLRDGVAAWRETATIAGSLQVTGLKASAGNKPTANLSTLSGVSLFGVGGGFVVFGEAGKVYSWNAATQQTKLIIEAPPNQILLSGTELYFVMGDSQVVYKIGLND